MRLYSYVVARDYGFAPNPFWGVCTLATCKPEIRKHAQIGDWVVGVGSKGCKLAGKVVYAMKVDETLTFDEYWHDVRFAQKRPNLRASMMQAFGDNIYHRDPKSGKWEQAHSHHSFRDGTPNMANVIHDTRVPRVLLGREFIYWGRSAIACPERFRTNICAGGRPVRNNFPPEVIRDFVQWVSSFSEQGFVGYPKEFDNAKRWG